MISHFDLYNTHSIYLGDDIIFLNFSFPRDLAQIMRCLEKDLAHVAPDIINSFYRDKRKLVPSIYRLCLGAQY